MSVVDPVDTIFHEILDREEAREAIEFGAQDHGNYGVIHLSLEYDDINEDTLVSVRVANEFANDLEAQAKQEGWWDDAEPIVTELRDKIRKVETW